MQGIVLQYLGYRFELNVVHVFKDSILKCQLTDYNHTTVNNSTIDNNTNEKFYEENTKCSRIEIRNDWRRPLQEDI